MTTSVQTIITNLHRAVNRQLAPEDVFHTLTSLSQKLKSYRCQRFLYDAGALRLCLYLLSLSSLTRQVSTLLLQIIHQFLLSTHESHECSAEIRVVLQDLPVKALITQLQQHGMNLQFLRAICKMLIALALKGSSLRSQLNNPELLRRLLDCFVKVDHFQTSNCCMSSIACLLCCSESSNECYLERFLLICWDKFESRPWRVFILKAACDLVVLLPGPISVSKRVAHILTETARLHGVDKQCGVMAFAAIVSCCEKSKDYPALFREMRLIHVLTPATMCFEDDPVSLMRLYTCATAVYLCDTHELHQRLVDEGALTPGHQVVLQRSEVMRANWSNTLHALALQRQKS